MADAFATRRAVLPVEDNPLPLMEAAAASRETGYEVADTASIEAVQTHLPPGQNSWPWSRMSTWQASL